MLFFAAALALTMALVSAINIGPEKWSGPPDEYLHRSAARYYVEHWLPPKVGDAATLDSYSPDYGFSYLNETDVVYFLAGKFAKIISPLISNHDIGFRLFNVLLLTALAYGCWIRPHGYLVFVPLLLSPQIWYIFSYFNGDAFPLFLSTLIAYQIASGESLFNKYLDGPGILRHASGALLLGLLVALLALSKKNYYAFLAFLPVVVALGRLGAITAIAFAASALFAAGVYLRWNTFGTQQLLAMSAGWAAIFLVAVFLRPYTRIQRGVTLVKLASIGVVAVALIVPRFVLDSRTEGSLEKKNATVGMVQEQLARPDYKPSKIYSGDPETFRGFTLRARGVSMADMFRPPWKWHQATFLSATGHYGWLQYRSPTPYYVLLGAAYAVLTLYLVWTAARSRDADAWLHLFGFCIFSCLTVGVSFWHSWNDDFQAQGRYLFPILPMLAVGMESSRKYLSPRIILALVTVCFTLSAYSFIFTALWQIPKAS